MTEIVIPQWFADKIEAEFGSLEEYVRQHWGGCLKITVPHWDDLAFESMNRINSRLQEGHRG